MKTKTLLIPAAGALALSGAAAPVWAAVTFVDGTLETYAAVQADADTNDATSSSNSVSPVEVLTGPYTYTLPATVNVTDMAGAATASATASALSSANLNASGFSFDFSGTGSANATGPAGYALSQAGTGLTYDFQSPADQTYMLTYNLSTPNIGCCGNYYTIEDLNTNSDILSHTVYNSDTSGTLTGLLIGGDAYRVKINQGQYPYYEAPTVSGSGSQTVTFDDRFSFTVGTPAVSAAPEPSGWALLLAGVGLSGFALRLAGRRRWAAA